MTIVVDDEQGYGDTIQSIRHVDALAARGARVIVRVRDELAALVATAAGVTDVVPLHAVPRCDAWVPAMSLPARLRVAPQGDGAGPYLRADPSRVAVRARSSPPFPRRCVSASPGAAIQARSTIAAAAPRLRRSRRCSSATAWRGTRCSAATARIRFPSCPRRSASTCSTSATTSTARPR
jgi:hypothetical protein